MGRYSAIVHLVLSFAITPLFRYHGITAIAVLQLFTLFGRTKLPWEEYERATQLFRHTKELRIGTLSLHPGAELEFDDPKKGEKGAFFMCQRADNQGSQC